ncbi:hypothetical protein K2F54_05005 [Cryobacterium sp. 1639]|uniref:DUF6412 domain-containing protein n=1 Tax=Cryobacterium inferilacus TaxID=2866629 RepID=UPI001C73589A|nr:DUF6412 domain-containing protein [Cryobacterium sp. 1639]MBX0299333.1 hypothetical protein [Cryobacterium sp. 1639]
MRALMVTLRLASPTARLSVALGLSLGVGLGAFSLGALSLDGRGFGELLALAAIVSLCASATAVTGAAQQVLAVLVMVLTGAPRPGARPHPELASQVGQSVPDAPGKPQPRAPGRALPVA